MIPRTGRWFCVMLALWAPAWAVRASDAEQAAALCEQAIVNGARRGGVPSSVLHAVALTETGRKQNGRVRPFPWAINREGKGHWFSTREEALAFARESLAAGRRSFDVGCVQINYRWHGHAFPSLEQMFDPEYTATYAAQFLRNLYEERGDWSAAAGAYHSLTPDLAAIYRKRFDQVLAGLEGDELPDAETLVARAAPAGRISTRAERRAAQRQAMAERIANAGPPPEPMMGSVAAMPFRPARGALLTEGTPLLRQAQPLLNAAPGGLF